MSSAYKEVRKCDGVGGGEDKPAGRRTEERHRTNDINLNSSSRLLSLILILLFLLLLLPPPPLRLLLPVNTSQQTSGGGVTVWTYSAGRPPHPQPCHVSFPRRRRFNQSTAQISPQRAGGATALASEPINKPFKNESRQNFDAATLSPAAV